MEREQISRIVQQVFGNMMGKDKHYLNDAVNRLQKHYEDHASKPLSRNDAIQIVGAVGRWMVHKEIN